MREARIKDFYSYLDEEYKKLSIGLVIALGINFLFMTAVVVYQKMQVPEKEITQEEAAVLLNLQQEEEIKKVKDVLEKPTEEKITTPNDPVIGDDPARALKGEPINPVDPSKAEIVPDALADTGRIDLGIRGVEGGVVNGVPGGSIYGTGLGGGGDYIPPKLMISKFPEYPKSLQKKGISGVIVLHVKVDTTGHVVDYKVTLNTTASSELEKLAIETVFKCRYNPASDGTHPIMAWTDHKFEFNDKSSQ